MIQINLIPDVKLELIRAQKQRNIIISVATLVTIVAMGLVVVTALYVFVVQFAREGFVDNNIEKNVKELKGIDEIDKIVTIQNQLSQIDQTHSSKALTSRIFSMLAVASSKGTENAVSITAFTFGKEEETITLTAQTDIKGFEAAEIFKKNIEALEVTYKPYNDEGKVPTSKEDQRSEKIASEVALSELATGEAAGAEKASANSVTFKLSFKYNAEALSMKNHIESISGLSKGNVTDSYTRLPNDLFSGTRSSNTGGDK